MPTSYINFHAPINQQTAQVLMTAITQKMISNVDEFYILFSTSGGDTPSGVALYNFIRGVPATVTMHNMGNVDSVGNAVFLAADNRFACPNSTFMFHGVFYNVNNFRLDENNAREYLRLILADQTRIGAIIVDRTAINERRARDFFRKTSTKNAQLALDAGIIHGIADARIPAGADLISFAFQP